MYLYAARQPILDRNKALYAYELLFRDGVKNAFPDIDGDTATTSLISGSFLGFSLDELLGDKPGFINFTLETLRKKYPALLPRQQIVVEILESETPDNVLLQECQQLKQQGYTLALDDYAHALPWQAFYPFIDIIKIDFRTTTTSTITQIKQAIADFPHIRLLAEKVETQEEYQQALDMGFSYFQGYFFSRPEMLQKKALAPTPSTLTELLYESSKADAEINKLVKLFERDVNLSYKLLRYSNSAAFRRKSEISTLRQALVTLGLPELRKFLSLLYTLQLNNKKPAILTHLSLNRAKFAEELAKIHGETDSSKAFLTGLLSLIDALLDQPMEDVMKTLPLATEIKQALINHTGILADYLKLIKLYESARWAESCEISAQLKLPIVQVSDAYFTAVQWANEQLKALAV